MAEPATCGSTQSLDGWTTDGAAEWPGGESLLDRVVSRCPGCGDLVPASIVERDSRVYQQVHCPRHPAGEVMIFSDAAFYRRLDAWNQAVFDGAHRGPAFDGTGAAADDRDDKPPLLAVVDLTNRCNYRCPVCFAEADTSSRAYYLDLATVRRMLERLLERHSPPCRHVQFSGGEPTLHPDFLDIVRLARDMGFSHIQVATNGSRFQDQAFVAQAEDAGLETLYLQFDGMDDDVYRVLRGRPLLEAKVRVVEHLTRTRMRLVLVPTIMSGVNVDQLGPIFRFALQHGHHVTGISVQPMAATGRVGTATGTQPAFNLADMAMEFGRQTGVTRFPDDWFPLNAIALLTRGVSRLRREPVLAPACDAHCSIGTYIHVDERNDATCLTRFFDLERFLRLAAGARVPAGAGAIRQPVSRLRDLYRLSSCFDRALAPRGLTFQRLLRGLDGWEDKDVGRGHGWFRRGFNGMFVAGMHFMDSRNYNLRRLRRCIIKYVTTAGDTVSFCRYNSGERCREAEDRARLDPAAWAR